MHVAQSYCTVRSVSQRIISLSIIYLVDNVWSYNASCFKCLTYVHNIMVGLLHVNHMGEMLFLNSSE